MMIIRRYREEERWKHTGPWRLVYGRRKTGKSFFVREFTEWGRYYFVLPNGSLRDVVSGKELSLDALIAILPDLLDEGIVVDEFQRLGRNFPEVLHSIGRRGKLTLITSSKYYAREMLSGRSPLLGLVSPFPMGLISPSDVLKACKNLELAVFIREPWLVGIVRELGDVVSHINLVPALLGEIFKEEERKLTDTYEAILLGISRGANTHGELRSFLSGKIKEANSLSSYLKIMEEIDLIKKVKVWGNTRYRYMYFHASPVVDFYYYLYRFGYPEVMLPLRTLERYLRSRLPHYIEAFVREFLSEYFGLPEGIYIERSREEITEIDVALGRKRIEVVAEVKWKERLTRKEVREIEEKLGRFEEARKILFVKDVSGVPETELEVWDVERMREVKKKPFGGL